MAILNVDNGFGGAMPCRIVDANGLDWSLVYECDTETGRIEKFVPHPETGRPYLDKATDDAARETVMAAAPLVAIPVEKT